MIKKKTWKEHLPWLLWRIFTIVLIIATLVLFLLIYKGRQSKPLEVDLLLEGKMPAQAQGLEPFLDDVSLPMEQKSGDVLIGINTKPTLENKYANWQIQNPIENQYIVDAEIILNDGTRVFSSGSIPPGSAMETAEVTKELSPGKHQATVYIFSYSQLTYEYCGVFTIEIEIGVK